MGRWIAGFTILCGLVYIAIAAPHAAQLKPQENYTGPIAEAPVIEPGDYWVYVRPDGTKFKNRTDSSLRYVSFPLWIGKSWSYETQSRGRYLQGFAERAALRIDNRCEVLSYKPVTAVGETFDAFECRCECSVPGDMDAFQCPVWTFWYAPAVKNIVRLDGESTAFSYRLAEYKFSKTVLKADDFDPKTAYDFTDRGNSHFDWKDYGKAIEDYNRAIELDSKYAPAFFNRARAYNAEQEYDAAITDYTQAIQLNRLDAVAFNNRGLIYARKKDYDRAIQDFNRAIVLSPTYALAFTNRGEVYREKKQYDRAIDDHNRAVELDPKYALNFFNRARAYNAKGDRDRAIQDYTEAIKLNSRYAGAYNNRGVLFRDKKEYEHAIQDYDEALRLNPKYVLALNNRANAYRSMQQYERAVADYETASRIDPKSAQHRNMGFTLFFIGQMTKSAEAMKSAVDATQDPYAMLFRYLTLSKQGGSQSALRELEENAAKVKESRWPLPIIQFYFGED